MKLTVLLFAILSAFQFNLTKAQSAPEGAKIPFYYPESLETLMTPVVDRGLNTYKKINPFYLRGDFNGDKVMDIAVLVLNKVGDKCIVISHGGKEESFLIAYDHPKKKVKADVLTPFGIAGAEFFWHVFTKEEAIDHHKGYRQESLTKRVPNTEAIHFGKMEGFSVMIYWDGEKYTFVGGGC